MIECNGRTYTYDEIVESASRENLMCFAKYVMPSIHMRGFHKEYYEVLDQFAHGEIKRLIVSMPPQHGKSQGSSRILPAFLLGINPDLKIVIGSYSATLSRGFNKDVQNILDSQDYIHLFPHTRISHSIYEYDMEQGGNAQKTTDTTDIVGHVGGLKAVGRGGGLTGKTVDIAILDDVYKDYEEANSPIVRESAWNWYTSVVRSRLHNDSQELIVFTRWHKDDIIGKLEEKENIVEYTSKKDLENLAEDDWLKINFEAIKTTAKTDIDPREVGEPLWEERHSLKRLLATRRLDKLQFSCLYQGDPESAEGRLYGEFKTWTRIEDYGVVIARGNYTDCADKGTDNLCSICYDKVQSSFKGMDGKPMQFLLVTDVVYTDDPIEKTTQSVPMMLNHEGTTYAWVESNNGGRAFAKLIEPSTRTTIKSFTQTNNKESRIITQAGKVTQCIIMPYGWETKYKKFHDDVLNFLRNFKANDHDDAPDALTGMIEKEILSQNRGIVRKN